MNKLVCRIEDNSDSQAGNLNLIALVFNLFDVHLLDCFKESSGFKVIFGDVKNFTLGSPNVTLRSHSVALGGESVNNFKILLLGHKTARNTNLFSS